MDSSILNFFHPVIRNWFYSRFESPTSIQKAAWPSIANGDHVLVSAPTGSGKTLTAFLWSLNQLFSNQWPTGTTSVLYISPLKALNNDIRRNLIVPLQQLISLHEKEIGAAPDIQVMTRSGDTPQVDRRRMMRKPPEIFITTPESLNVMLSSASAGSFFNSIQTVILDEIHTVFPVKRGAYLMSAIERLVEHSGEFQRIVISATVKPLESVARFAGGYRIIQKNTLEFKARPVRIIQVPDKKGYHLTVKSPDGVSGNNNAIWDRYASSFLEIIKSNTATLIFTNSRRLCEKLTSSINNLSDSPIVYAHHGSLSREIRQTVERNLKTGKLQGIVATNSLELGIDIGHLDQVILVQSPPSISAAIQRVGRAGHQAGEISQAVLFPSHPLDIIEATVVTRSILEGDIETLRPIHQPLDVLAQILISMTSVKTWHLQSLFNQVRCVSSFNSLTWDLFLSVIQMLAGQYAGTRIHELKARISLDSLDNTVVAMRGARLALFFSGGVIPDRGYYQLRRQDSGARIGELDEEFVWEARVGQVFTLGAQKWKIQKITNNDVQVVPGNPSAAGIPFWRGEGFSRDSHFSLRIMEFLEIANQNLHLQEFQDMLNQVCMLTPSASNYLIRFLKFQQNHTQLDLPHRHHILIEYVESGPDKSPGHQLILHTFWGLQVNRPYAMALAAAWEDLFHQAPEIFSTNNAISLLLPNLIPSEDIMRLVTSTNIDRLLRKSLGQSGFFGARFRECAGRSLLLGKNKFNQRMPLWMSRLKSQKLLQAVSQYPDFPILLETWRTTLQDEFDLHQLRIFLDEIASGVITFSECNTLIASPLAEGITWRQVNKYMYMGDDPTSTQPFKLQEDLLEQIMFDPESRPRISPELCTEYQLKRQRLISGYAPQNGRELVDWLKERKIIPENEWMQLLNQIYLEFAQDLADDIKGKYKILTTPSHQRLIIPMETAPHIESALSSAGETSEQCQIIQDWLSYYGPVSIEFICSTLAISMDVISHISQILIQKKIWINGQLIENDPSEFVCDATNYKIILNMRRTKSKPAIEPLSAKYLSLFLSRLQGLQNRSNSSQSRLIQILQQLQCLPLPAGFWESDLFPARLNPYDPAWLDSACQNQEVIWSGFEDRKICFTFPGDIELISSNPNTTTDEKNLDPNPVTHTAESQSNIEHYFRDQYAKYDFPALMVHSGLSSSELGTQLWTAVWNHQITNDGFAALRNGVETDFCFQERDPAPYRHRHSRRISLNHWRKAVPFSGNWFKLPKVSQAEDSIYIEEMNKTRVRILLLRYGVLSRELLEKELPPFQWSALFKTLRTMELSGEIFAGNFFDHLSGPQFISSEGLKIFKNELHEETIYWLNAMDPASLCGIGIETLREGFPRRLPGNYLVFKGANLLAVIQRNGRQITFRVPESSPDCSNCLLPVHHLLSRKFKPLRSINIETINDQPASTSEYLTVIKNQFDTSIDINNLIIYRKL